MGSGRRDRERRRTRLPGDHVGKLARLGARPGTVLTPLRLGIVAATSIAVLHGGTIRAQHLPEGVAPDTLRFGPGTPVLPVSLAEGESIAVWVRNDVRITDDHRALPVPEAAAGEVIASFEASRLFAWPLEPTVWTAPGDGALRFAINVAEPAAARGSAAVLFVRLDGVDGSRSAFEPPIIALDRIESGVRVRYADRAGFGLDTGTLSLSITTMNGVTYRLGPWTEPGPRGTTLDLPPRGIDLPAGVHRLEARITDRLGNVSPPAVFLFDTGGRDSPGPQREAPQAKETS